MTPRCSITAAELVEIAADAMRNAGGGWRPEYARAALLAVLPALANAEPYRSCACWRTLERFARELEADNGK